MTGSNQHWTRFDVVRSGMTCAGMSPEQALDEIELSYTAAIAQRDRYRAAHARLEEQLETLRGALQETVALLPMSAGSISGWNQIEDVRRRASALLSNPAKRPT